MDNNCFIILIMFSNILTLHNMIILYVYLIYISQTVIYFLHCTLVISLYIEVVLKLSSNETKCFFFVVQPRLWLCFVISMWIVGFKRMHYYCVQRMINKSVMCTKMALKLTPPPYTQHLQCRIYASVNSVRIGSDFDLLLIRYQTII